MMQPNIYKLSEMTKEEYDFIMRRAETDITEHMKVAKEVSDDIKNRGDAAVLEYTKKFDHVTLIAQEMKVTPEEIEEERRMFYVAMTRAKKHLEVLYIEDERKRHLQVCRF